MTFPDLGLERRIQALERFMREIHGDRGATEPATWVPTWTGLTVVGAPTYAGRYTSIGRQLVIWQVDIFAGGANTTASTAGTTYIDNMPFTAAQYNLFTGYNLTTFAALGVGGVFATLARAYTPTWVATNGQLVLSGWYEI